MPLFGFYMHVMIIVRRECGMIRGLRLRIFYLSIKFDYVLIEVVVFKVFGVDRLRGLVFDRAPYFRRCY